MNEVELQNRITDVLRALEAARGGAEDEVVRRLARATSAVELDRMCAALGVPSAATPARPARVPPETWWRAVEALEQEAEREPDLYGGRYSDDDTLLSVGLVNRINAIVPRLRARFGFASRLYVFSVELPLVVLHETERRVAERYDDLMREGFPLAGYGLDVLRNRVVLALESDVERHEPRLRELLGPGVAFERGEPATTL
jgi:hypothetical protein